MHTKSPASHRVWAPDGMERRPARSAGRNTTNAVGSLPHDPTRDGCSNTHRRLLWQPNPRGAGTWQVASTAYDRPRANEDMSVVPYLSSHLPPHYVLKSNAGDG